MAVLLGVLALAERVSWPAGITITEMPNITFTAPTGAAHVPVSISGALPSITLAPPAGVATAQVDVTGALPNITLAPPTGMATTEVEATGALPNINFTAPTGVAQVAATAVGSLPNITFGAPTGSASATSPSLAVVQTSVTCGGGGGGSQTPGPNWPSTPTSGNLLVAIGLVYSANGAPSANAGWTLATYTPTAANNWYIGVLYKYAGASESQNPVIISGSYLYWGLSAWEVSGVSGTWSTDFVAAHLNPGWYSGSSSPQTTTSFNTSDNNELVLGCVAQNNGLFNGGASFSTTYGTTDGVAYNPGYWTAACMGFHNAVASSGTAVSASIAGEGAGGSYGYGFVELAS